VVTQCAEYTVRERRIVVVDPVIADATLEGRIAFAAHEDAREDWDGFVEVTVARQASSRDVRHEGFIVVQQRARKAFAARLGQPTKEVPPCFGRGTPETREIFSRRFTRLSVYPLAFRFRLHHFG
jgi:hypothetical protein